MSGAAPPTHDALPVASGLGPVPADRGLSTLGLLMQLAGTMFASVMLLQMLVMLLESRGRMPGGAKWMIFIIVTCAVRSMVHRRAGSELLYGTSTAGPSLRGLRRYIFIGLGHSALVALLLVSKVEVPGKLAFATFLGLALWPAVLAGALAWLGLWSWQREVPLAEDNGFEAASIVMALMGLAASLVGGVIVVVVLNEGGRALDSGYGMMLFLALVLLFIRSILHAIAGIGGIGASASFDLVTYRALRYANFGVIAACTAAGAVMFLLMRGRVHPATFAMVALVAALLLAWPLIVRRFFMDRRVQREAGGSHRRAPDLGLVGLGWFLLATAAAGAAFLIPQLWLGGEMGMKGIDALGAAFNGGASTRSMWFNVAIVIAQAAAGVVLIRMHARAKPIAMGFAVLSIAVTVYKLIPMLDIFDHLGAVGLEMLLQLFLPLLIALMVPVATILLVARYQPSTPPAAVARYR